MVNFSKSKLFIKNQIASYQLSKAKKAHQQQSLHEEIGALRHAQRLAPQSPDVLREIIKFCIARGNIQEALVFARQLHSATANITNDDKIQLMKIYAFLGKKDEAYKQLREVLSADENSKDELQAGVDLAKIYRDYKLILTVLYRFLAKNPEDEWANFQLASFGVYLGDKKTRARAFAYLSELAPKNTRLGLQAKMRLATEKLIADGLISEANFYQNLREIIQSQLATNAEKAQAVAGYLQLKPEDYDQIRQLCIALQKQMDTANKAEFIAELSKRNIDKFSVDMLTQLDEVETAIACENKQFLRFFLEQQLREKNYQIARIFIKKFSKAKNDAWLDFFDALINLSESNYKIASSKAEAALETAIYTMDDQIISDSIDLLMSFGEKQLIVDILTKVAATFSNDSLTLNRAFTLYARTIADENKLLDFVEKMHFALPSSQYLKFYYYYAKIFANSEIELLSSAMANDTVFSSQYNNPYRWSEPTLNLALALALKNRQEMKINLDNVLGLDLHPLPISANFVCYLAAKYLKNDTLADELRAKINVGFLFIIEKNWAKEMSIEF